MSISTVEEQIPGTAMAGISYMGKERKEKYHTVGTFSLIDGKIL